jgi:broad specificity phosphatase PhoE
MTKIILTRHGHVEGIEPERFRGRADLALTELGEQQAQAVAARIAANWKPAGIYSSPMRRCQATAAAIARACGAPSEVLDDLNDIDYGEWQWRTHEEVRAAAPDLLLLWCDAPQLVRFPSGESLQDLAARAANVLRLMMQRHAEAAETVVLVGHDSVNRVLLTQLLDQPLSAIGDWRSSLARSAKSISRAVGCACCGSTTFPISTRLADDSPSGG